MGRMYATRKNKYSPPSNTKLVEAARGHTECVHEGNGISNIVPDPVDTRVVVDIDSLEIDPDIDTSGRGCDRYGSLD